MLGIGSIINTILNILLLAILASVIISWLRAFGMRISPYHPVVRIIEQMADLVLAPIRRAFPVTAGGWDFSPIVAVILIQIVQAVLVRVL